MGTRLLPLTKTTPKQLLPIAEVTGLERVLEHLSRHGVNEVVLSLGYKPDAFLDMFPDDTCAGVALTYAVEPEPLDTAGAIRFAADAAGVDDTFLVLNGDILTDLDVGALVAFHREREAEGTIHLAQVEDPSAFGVVPVDEAGRVERFVEKPPRDEAPTDWINAGTYVLEPSVLERIPAGRRVSIERETFPELVGERRLYAMPSPAYWIDTGTLPKFIEANLDLVARDTAPAPKATLRESGVWTIGAAVIDGDVMGPALVGDACLVAASAHVERSVLGAGARVLEGARVARSVLLPGAVIGPGAVVEDSIVGAAALVAEGAEVRSMIVAEDPE
jgi:NDP-sugar pyrophosphorylase family protein